MTKESTFASLQLWLESLKQNGEADLIIMLVGNKTDLVQQYGEEAREVPTEAAEHFAKLNRLMFIETSAVSSQNVREAFENLLQEIHTQRQRMPKAPPKNPLILETEGGNTPQ